MIKVGEMYNVRVKVNGYNLAKTAVKAWDCSGLPCYFKLEDLSPISPSPKYDPCRRFKKGDIVTPKERNGRIPWGKDMKLIVVADERMSGVTVRHEESGEARIICALFLELVTPVEELEPYSVRHNAVHAAWSIYGPYGLSAVNYFYGERYPYTEETAKHAAEAERDRLNAEYRKEQK